MGVSGYSTDQDRWDFPGNTHWNVESHRVAAEVLYENLLPLLQAGHEVDARDRLH